MECLRVASITTSCLPATRTNTAGKTLPRERRHRKSLLETGKCFFLFCEQLPEIFVELTETQTNTGEETFEVEALRVP